MSFTVPPQVQSPLPDQGAIQKATAAFKPFVDPSNPLDELAGKEHCERVFSTVWLWGMTGLFPAAAKEPHVMGQTRMMFGEDVRVVAAPIEWFMQSAVAQAEADPNKIEGYEVKRTSNLLLKYLQTVTEVEWTNQIPVYHGVVLKHGVLYVPPGWVVALLPRPADLVVKSSAHAFGLRMSVAPQAGSKMSAKNLLIATKVLEQDVDEYMARPTPTSQGKLNMAQRDMLIIKQALSILPEARRDGDGEESSRLPLDPQAQDPPRPSMRRVGSRVFWASGPGAGRLILLYARCA